MAFVTVETEYKTTTPEPIIIKYDAIIASWTSLNKIPITGTDITASPIAQGKLTMDANLITIEIFEFTSALSPLLKLLEIAGISDDDIAFDIATGTFTSTRVSQR